MDGAGHPDMDHAAMDHGAMDHGSMDHGSMDHGSADLRGMGHGGMDQGIISHHAMMMVMSFHGGCDEVILFEWWKISTVAGLVGSMIGCFLLGILYEGLKFYREFLLGSAYSSVNYNNVEPNNDGGSDENSISSVQTAPRRNTAIKIIQTNILSKTHFIQTLLQLVQVTLSYFLMLIAMTYNSWLFGAVVTGATAGYFIFGWKKTVMMETDGGCH